MRDKYQYLEAMSVHHEPEDDRIRIYNCWRTRWVLLRNGKRWVEFSFGKRFSCRSGNAKYETDAWLFWSHFGWFFPRKVHFLLLWFGHKNVLAWTCEMGNNFIAIALITQEDQSASVSSSKFFVGDDGNDGDEHNTHEWRWFLFSCGDWCHEEAVVCYLSWATNKPTPSHWCCYRWCCCCCRIVHTHTTQLTWSYPWRTMTEGLYVGKRVIFPGISSPLHSLSLLVSVSPPHYNHHYHYHHHHPYPHRIHIHTTAVRAQKSSRRSLSEWC